MSLFDDMSPAVRNAWQRSLTSGRAAMTRRRLLRAGGLAAGGGALAACGIPPAASTGDDGGSHRSKDYSKEEKRLVFSNWPLYIDVDGENKQRRPTLARFEQRTGIEVKYIEDINDNNSFYSKIKPQLAAGQDTGRDLICLTDWMAGRLIRHGWVQRLDPAHLPHAVTNLEDRFRAVPHDPNRQFSYPWAGIATVVAYNKKATGGKKITSVGQLLDDPSLKGRVSLLTEMQDTMGMVMLDMGADSESFTDDDFDAALARVQKTVDRGQIRRFTGNDYIDGLGKGDIAACLAWAGDIVQLKFANPDIDFHIPDSGYLRGTDDLMVPARARHRVNAEKLIDYYYQPEVAAELAAWVNYICPVTGAQAEMAKIDKELAENPLIFPGADMQERGHSFRQLTDEEAERYQSKFAGVIGA